MPAGYASSGICGLSIVAPMKQDQRMLNFAVNITNLFGFKALEPRY